MHRKREKRIVMEETKIPIGGPSTWEEALMDLEDSEREIDAQQGTSWEVVKEMMEDRIYNYANQVY